MGTRNLTIVRIKNKTKVAQYGQWDGYPTGQGQTIADFLKKADLEKFKKQVSKLKVWKSEDVKKAYKDLGIGEWMNQKEAQKVNDMYPEFNRDYGANILNLIYEGKINKVLLNEDFKNDGLYCEYYYEIDLDNETVSMNGGKPHSFKWWTTTGRMQKLEDKE